MICLCFRCECSVNIELMEIRTQKCSLCGYLVDSILYELCKRAIFSNFYQTFTICRCRIPHGMRGLKFRMSDLPLFPCMSHPAWDAWIEINLYGVISKGYICRIPHGMRGLKSNTAVLFQARQCRIPHGMRGLKFASTEHLSICSGRIPHGMRGLKYGLLWVFCR